MLCNTQLVLIITQIPVFKWRSIRDDTQSNTARPGLQRAAIERSKRHQSNIPEMALVSCAARHRVRAGAWSVGCKPRFRAFRCRVVY